MLAPAGMLSACQSTHAVMNGGGRPTTYHDPGTRGPVAGIGIESQEIVGMTDHMVRGMLAGPALSAQAEPLQIIIDTEYFYNDGASRLKSNTITDRLRVTLTAPEGYRVRNSVDTSLHEGTRCPPGALVALRRRSGGSAA